MSRPSCPTPHHCRPLGQQAGAQTAQRPWCLMTTPALPLIMPHLPIWSMWPMQSKGRCMAHHQNIPLLLKCRKWSPPQPCQTGKPLGSPKYPRQGSPSLQIMRLHHVSVHLTHWHQVTEVQLAALSAPLGTGCLTSSWAQRPPCSPLLPPLQAQSRQAPSD